MPKMFRPRPAVSTFKFPYRIGGRSLATGGYSAAPSSRPSKAAPSIKQFTDMKPGRPAKQSKGR